MPTAASKFLILMNYSFIKLDSLGFFLSIFSPETKQNKKKEQFVYYFCYGSNLLIQRMKINNKSAMKHANGLLNEFRLSFAGNSQLWQGATANIVPDSNVCV